MCQGGCAFSIGLKKLTKGRHLRVKQHLEVVDDESKQLFGVFGLAYSGKALVHPEFGSFPSRRRTATRMLCTVTDRSEMYPPPIPCHF